MIYLEMSRDMQHGGGTWSFPNCVWSPARKRNGSEWPYWTNVLGVREGDTIIHLRGVRPEAAFIGFSRASGNGFETNRRPPSPGEWGFAESFYRADLSDFMPFHSPVLLDALFHLKKDAFENYFESNKIRGNAKQNIFFVRQAGKLQCQNGAYLSDVDDEMLELLFEDNSIPSTNTDEQVPLVSVETSSQIAEIRTRIGQSRFAREVKELYRFHCCFPECGVEDPRFLVASHIARWSDNEGLRGQLGNGLCLCLVHDKAFEIGIFTLDEEFRVFANPKEKTTDSAFIREIVARHGKQISLANIRPSADALIEHWIRVGIDP